MSVLSSLNLWSPLSFYRLESFNVSAEFLITIKCFPPPGEALDLHVGIA